MNYLDKILKYPIHHALGGYDTSGGLEQNANELNQFCNWLVENQIKTVLEIGMASGLLNKFLREEMGLQCFGINDKVVKGVTFLGNSQDRAIIDKVGNYDLIFVDGDHNLAKLDFLNYREKCKFMAFHDICGLRDCGAVSELWGVVKKVHKHWEFIDEANPGAMAGIGVIEIYWDFPEDEDEIKNIEPEKIDIKVTGAKITGIVGDTTFIETKEKPKRKGRPKKK